ncbi:hypothetical protein G9C98_003126 [Cotesia typhae]|nr:hypothetical protein G9C98_003126 [Cotesia typhae]
MQKSCDIASEAITKTIKVSKAGMTEHQLFATVDYECRMNGAEFLAYPPVIAGDRNANVIHYITNNQILNNGDMVLMDAERNIAVEIWCSKTSMLYTHQGNMLYTYRTLDILI